MVESRLGRVIEELVDTVDQRAGADPELSYTAGLVQSGTERCARKFGEEAIELVIALMGPDREAVTAEAADVLFHLLVALRASGIGSASLAEELEHRRGRSGLAEKLCR